MSNKTARNIGQGILAIVVLAAIGAGLYYATMHRSVSSCTNLVLTHSLTIGSTDTANDEEVSKLQTYLRAWGEKIMEPKVKDLPVTGYFGSQTRTAVALYQKIHNIPTDPESDVATTTEWDNPNYGIVGPRTRNLLNKSCLEGGFSAGIASPATDPLITSVVLGAYQQSLSQPLTVAVTVLPITFKGFIELYIVPANHSGQWQTLGREVAQTGDIRDGFSGTLKFNITDFSGGGLPQHAGVVDVTPGTYTIVAHAYDGTSNGTRVMDTMSLPVTFTR